MRICDYEKAVASLNAGVMLDKVELKGKHVYSCNGHTDTKYVEWDEFGRAYGHELVDDGDEGCEINRMPEFDLKFE